jgi:hypothetical protein
LLSYKSEQVSQVIQGAKKQKRDTTDKYGRVHWFSINVSPRQLSRTYLFLEGVVRLFENFGWQLKEQLNQYSDQKGLIFVSGNDSLLFEIKEPVKQTRHIKTKEDNEYWGLTFNYHPTGLLEFSIEGL